MGKMHPASRQAVQVRRFEKRMACDAKIGMRPVVGHDQDDVRPSYLTAPAGSRRQQEHPHSAAGKLHEFTSVHLCLTPCFASDFLLFATANLASSIPIPVNGIGMRLPPGVFKDADRAP